MFGKRLLAGHYGCLKVKAVWEPSLLILAEIDFHVQRSWSCIFMARLGGTTCGNTALSSVPRASLRMTIWIICVFLNYKLNEEALALFPRKSSSRVTVRG